MARKPKKKAPSPFVQAAADRAERRAKGLPIDTPKAPIDPVIVKADVPPEVRDEPTEETKSELGRPSGYEPEFAVQAASLCAAGATDPELADFFGISTRTINRWKVAHADFRQAIKESKDIADDRVHRSLYHRAMGTEYEEAVPIKLKRINFGPDGKKVSEEEYVETVMVRKVIPADTTAAIFWLKNRRADKWRDVHKHEVGAPGEFSNMSDQELSEFIKSEIPQVVPKRAAGDKTKH